MSDSFSLHASQTRASGLWFNCTRYKRARAGELFNQLDEDEKNTLVKIINSMLTKKRMKNFAGREN